MKNVDLSKKNENNKAITFKKKFYKKKYYKKKSNNS